MSACLLVDESGSMQEGEPSKADVALRVGHVLLF
jgi:hypothetical protein